MAPYIFSQLPLTSSKKSHDITPQKFKPESNQIFLIEARRLFTSLEGLNSSLALSDGNLWLDKIQATVVALQSLRLKNIFYWIAYKGHVCVTIGAKCRRAQRSGNSGQEYSTPSNL